MARPKVHQQPRRTTGLKLDEDVHQALRDHNEATGVPMNRTTQDALVEKLTREGFYPPGKVRSISQARATLRKTS